MFKRNNVSSDKVEKFMDEIFSGVGFLLFVENIFFFIIF